MAQDAPELTNLTTSAESRAGKRAAMARGVRLRTANAVEAQREASRIARKVRVRHDYRSAS